MLYEAIMILFPSARVNEDFGLRDDSDGNGPYIEFWDEAALRAPMPKKDELDAAIAIYQPPKPEDLIEAEITSTPALLALTKVIAERFGMTEEALIADIKRLSA